MLKLGGGHMGVSYIITCFSVCLKYFTIKDFLRKEILFSFFTSLPMGKESNSSSWYFSLDYYNILTDLPAFLFVPL